jgi:NAD(P) transhydrogenase
MSKADSENKTAEKPESFEYDLVVIGSGPGGESAAMSAIKHDRRVALIEEQDLVGGNCTHKGTIPSKALRHAVHQVMQFNTNKMFRDIALPTWLTFEQVRATAQKVIDQQVIMRSRFYTRNGVELIKGRASFVDPYHIKVSRADNNDLVLSTKNVVIATGSRPWQPPGVDFTHPRVFDSDKILDLAETPRRIIIYGAGVIGSEYASIFSGLGCKVDLVNPGDRLLSFMDDEISDALSYHLRQHGVLVRHSESFESVEANDAGVVVHLESGKALKGDIFLWANGRSGNTSGLGLENIGVEANHRGQLEVNRNYQTQTKNIYAVGDVVGWPALASAAYDQGRSSSNNIFEDDTYRFVEDVPTGIYTIPEISSVGKTEGELTKAKIPYEVGKAYFKETARAQITGETTGVLKILFHRESLQLLGIHCFGDQAAEILHIGQAIMAQKGKANTLMYFLEHTFNYPTMAEAYRVAALNGLNRLHGD